MDIRRLTPAAMPALCLLIAAAAAPRPACAQATEPFSSILDLSQLELLVPDILEVSDPRYESIYFEDAPTTLAKHIRLDTVLQGGRGQFAVFLDGDVRLHLHLEWAPPELRDASTLRLISTATMEITNLSFLVRPVLVEPGPCGDEAIELLSFGIDVYGIPVKVALSTRLCGAMTGTCEGAITGWVQARCGLEPEEDGGVPLPLVDFDRSFELAEGARADGDAELDILHLEASAAVARMGASLVDAKFEASCPFIGARTHPEGGGEIEFGAKAGVTVNCSAMLKLLGMTDQRREASYTERLVFE